MLTIVWKFIVAQSGLLLVLGLFVLVAGLAWWHEIWWRRHYRVCSSCQGRGCRWCDYFGEVRLDG